MKYIYFVSFTFPKDESNGYGMADVEISHKVKRMEDIMLMADKIEKHFKLEYVVIQNYILLREEIA